MITSICVTLLALVGNSSAFSFSPSATALRRDRSPTAARQQHARFANAPQALSWTPRSNAVSREGGTVVLKASDLPAAGGGGGASSRPPLDVAAVAKYIAGTAAEFTIIMGLLALMQGKLLPRLPAKWAQRTVFLTFGFLAMKSRTFSLLNARRPSLAKEKEEKIERRRPDWMPPIKAFPVIWITIGVLRALSTAMASVWEALGGNLVATPIAAMVLHLSVGDTWNHINNVEKKLGVAVSGVFLVWLSVANAVYRYYQVLPKAGLVLLPSLLWISVANLLVQSIWRLNGKEPLYPPKRTS
ncbi:unnamed protein product [Ectocarpus sp. 6 AP-2014]